MHIKPIRTKKEHKAALPRIQEPFDLEPKEGGAEFAELELLAMVVVEYEGIHCPVPPPDPIEAIKFRSDRMGMTEKDLDALLGSRQRRSGILSGKRKLSPNMIRRPHERLEAPATANASDSPHGRWIPCTASRSVGGRAGSAFHRATQDGWDNRENARQSG